MFTNSFFVFLSDTLKIDNIFLFVFRGEKRIVSSVFLIVLCEAGLKNRIDSILFPKIFDLLKNDDTINRISRKKIQWAADEIESIHFWDDIKRLFNSFRHKERPFIKAKYFLSEAIMDSRVALNESSDTEILFVENLLKNYLSKQK